MIEFAGLENLTEWSNTSVNFKSWILLFIFSSLWVLKRYSILILYLFIYFLFFFYRNKDQMVRKLVHKCKCTF